MILATRVCLVNEVSMELMEDRALQVIMDRLVKLDQGELLD